MRTITTLICMMLATIAHAQSKPPQQSHNPIDFYAGTDVSLDRDYYDPFVTNSRMSPAYKQLLEASKKEMQVAIFHRGESEQVDNMVTVLAKARENDPHVVNLDRSRKDIRDWYEEFSEYPTPFMAVVFKDAAGAIQVLQTEPLPAADVAYRPAIQGYYRWKNRRIDEVRTAQRVNVRTCQQQRARWLRSFGRRRR